MKIAIDGPAGAGKSTIAKLLAGKLGYIYIDTGAMYRALTLKAIQQGIDLDDYMALTELAQTANIYFRNEGELQTIYCDGENVTELIRSPEINGHVSKVAAYPTVRTHMVKKQQALANSVAVVMDGRDIGECVLPDADFKFFLTASIEERAHRRVKELAEKGHHLEEREVQAQITKRDADDTNRGVGALKILDESIVVDTTNKNIEEVLNLLISYINWE